MPKKPVYDVDMELAKRDSLLALGTLLMSLGGALFVQQEYWFAILFLTVAMISFAIRLLLKMK